MAWLLLARHASTAASTAGRNLGQRDDPPLTDAGRDTAADVGAALSLELSELGGVETRIVSSPALRCRQTATAIAVRIGNPAATAIEVDARLIEIDYGNWDGLTAEECFARDPELRAAWERDPAATRCPDGESGQDVADRIAPAFAELWEWLAGSEDRAVVAVAHNHVNRLELCRLLGWPLADYRRRLVQSPGGYNVIGRGEDHPTIVRINAPARSVPRTRRSHRK